MNDATLSKISDLLADMLSQWVLFEKRPSSMAVLRSQIGQLKKLIDMTEIKDAEEHSRAKFAPMVQASQPSKLCIHCRHHGTMPGDPIGDMETRIDLCRRFLNPVCGGLYSQPAFKERMGGKCGMDAKFWEPKEAK